MRRGHAIALAWLEAQLMLNESIESTPMASDVFASLPPLDSRVRETLVRLQEGTRGVTDQLVHGLAWASFYRGWDAEIVESYGKAKAAGARIVIPTGPRVEPPPIDPGSRWAYAMLGMRHGVTAGQAVVCGEEVEQAWLDERPVSLETYERASERYVREIAALYPDGALARELRALDERRRRLRFARAVVVSFTPRSRSAAVSVLRANRRRAPRRARRAAVTRRARIKSGGDPPEPPTRRPLVHCGAGAGRARHAAWKHTAGAPFLAVRGRR